MIVLIELFVGMYSIFCIFFNNVVIEIEKVVFKVYNRLVILLLSILLSEVEIKSVSFNVIIIGIGFVNIGYVVCVKVGFFVKFGFGFFVSVIEVICLFFIIVKFFLFNVLLVFGENDFVVDFSVEFLFYVV